MPYNGSENYIFVSYAHKDSDTVMPVIEAMKQNGFRIWYDRGIEAGTEWAEYIEEHLIGADSFILFLSRAMIESQNCREEFGLARDEKKNILVVYIEDLQPSDLKHGLRLRIPSYQCLFRARHKNDNSFIKEICDARILQACRGASAPSAKPEKATPAAAPKKKAPSEGISYNLTRNESAYSVNGIGDCQDKDIVIPAEHEGLPVTAVEKSAFSGNTDITSVTLPDSVSFIGSGAFYGCTSLASFVLPKSVSDIGIYTFFGCTSLSSLRLHKKISGIEIGAFMDCPHLTALDFDGTRAEWNKIADASPAWDDDTAIRTVRCSDGEVNYDREGPAPGTEVVSGDGLAFTIAPGGESYVLSGVGECDAADIAVPETYEGLPVTRIEDNAFAGNTTLRTLTLPDSITYIGSSAFSGCSSLISAIIPEKVESIEMCCFMGCTALSTLIIEGGVKSIDVCAFAGCENLTEITYTGTKAAWGEVEKNSWKWNDGSGVKTIHCTDGDYNID